MLRNYPISLFAFFVLSVGGVATAAPWNPDLNGDGALDCADINIVSSLSLLGLYIPTADYNCDGIIDQRDIANWRRIAGRIVLGPGRSFCPGDANLDGVVDQADFAILQSNAFTTTFFWCDGDFNNDGVVDFLDYVIWINFRGQTC